MSQPARNAYMPTLPRTWWLKRWVYTRFMIREITAVFVAAYVVELVILISRLA
ncbi:MAG: fumarate reductase subunit C, partial [Chloroflexi bacterium]|nr:fumarate reductase subunit C [Chloroflexota bacterium]